MIFPYKAILFDWAYTLVDLVEEDDRAAFLKMADFLQEKGIKLPPFNLFFNCYQELFYGLISESRQTHREACFETVLRHLFFKYRIEIKNRTSWKDILKTYYGVIHGVRKVYPDVINTLQQLQLSGVRMGVVSNTTNPEFIKKEELSRTELDKYFEFAIYSSSAPYRKPHPSIYKAAIARLQIDVKDILFVGDNLIMDVEGPQITGIDAAWLNRDNSSLINGIVPDYQIKSLNELFIISPVRV